MGENSNGDGRDPQKTSSNDNVIPLPTLKEREARAREMAEEAKIQMQNSPKEHFFKGRSAEALINLPPVTKVLVAAFVIFHLIVSFLVSDVQHFWIVQNFGFLPVRYMNLITDHVFSWSVIAGPFTYIFLHGDWIHLMMNVVMFTAFGSGVERWMGSRKMLLFFYACAWMAALAHFVLNPESINPVIGASGGISGLFAAVLVMLRHQGLIGQDKHGLLPFIVLWIIVSAVFGYMGGPNGSTIAWVAHIGGFLSGFLILKPIMKL